MRAEHAAPLLAELGKWLEGQTFLPKSLIGKAATYTRNQWKALNQYVEDGDLSIDNNFAERAMRPIAIGRKNWLFVGSRMAGERSAILTSLIASCKNNLVEPWAYLRDLFGQMASHPTCPFGTGAISEILSPVNGFDCRLISAIASRDF
jgi:hypothetical protein